MANDVEDFAQLSIQADARALLDFVDQHINEGSTIDQVFVDLLAPTARRLGEYWESDQNDLSTSQWVCGASRNIARTHVALSTTVYGRLRATLRTIFYNAR
ncbi:MAG: hypothetical protein HC767_14000 [Akkermansiaceae bacterium]|nr:hypothetical protein [Akkermansiaceae bacterium]